MQGYLDNELTDSERLLVDRHVDDCKPCKVRLKNQQTTSVVLFETLGEFRLTHDLTRTIMENLPEIERLPIDVEGVNWRAKHPGALKEKLLRFAPLAAAVLLVVLGAVIRDNWPSAPVPSDAIGVASYDRIFGSRESYITPNRRFTTGDNERMTLSLLGSTQLKVNGNSEVWVTDERTVRIDRGQVLFDVGADSHSFKVETPSGRVEVYGTLFDVQVLEAQTMVTLGRGHVQVFHGEDESVSEALEPDEQVEIRKGDATLNLQPVDSGSVLSWADDVGPSQEADSMYAAYILPKQDVASIKSQTWQVLQVHQRGVDKFEFQWVPDGITSDHFDYDFVVYSVPGGETRFSQRIDGSVFDDQSRSSLVMEPGDKTLGRRSDILRCQLLPNTRNGSVTAPSITISAITVEDK